MNYKKQVIIEVPDEDDGLRNEDFELPQSRKQTHKSNQSKQKSDSITENISMTQIPPLIKKQMCEQHNQEITLLCCMSSWHCEPLCIECIPSHTQQHNKNKTQPQIKKYEEVQQTCKDKCQKFVEGLGNLKSHVQELIDKPYEDENMRNIKMWSDQIINLVQNYFTTIINEYNEKIKQLKSDENDNFEKLLLNINRIQSEYSTRLEDVTLFNLNPEKELNQLMESISSNKTKNQEEYKLNTILQKYLIDNIGRMVLIETKQQQQNVQPKYNLQNPQPQIKQKSTKCPTCGQQMVYVSEFKKHLECPNCSKIKRPNSQKK